MERFSMMREFIKKLRMIADNIEANLNELDSILPPSGQRIEHEILKTFSEGFNDKADEKAKGKSHIIYDKLFDKFPTREEFMKKWTEKPVPYRWTPANKKQEEGRMKRKYTKLYPHWTQRPENKEKLAKIIRKMQRAKKAK